MSGELAVRAAVMLQAIVDLSSEEGEIRKRAWLWVTGESPSPRGFSFHEIADLFGLDHDAVREAVLSKSTRARGPHNLRHDPSSMRQWRVRRSYPSRRIPA
jgi:hypothetical protein